MAFTIVANTKEVQDWLGRVQAGFRPAVAAALNRTMAAIEQTELNALERDLDRPVPFTFNAFGVLKASEKYLDTTLFVRPIQAKYLAWAIEGGTLPVILKPTKSGQQILNAYGNIPGKKGGLQGIADLAKRTRFVATIRGITGVWERYAGDRLRLLVRVAYRDPRAKRLRYYEAAQEVVDARFRRDLAEAIRDAAARA